MANFIKVKDNTWLNIDNITSIEFYPNGYGIVTMYYLIIYTNGTNEVYEYEDKEEAVSIIERFRQHGGNDMLGHFYIKDENGNWIPIFKANNADISINNDEAKGWSTEVMKSMDMEVSAEFTISEESEATLWAMAEGGIEIVER